MVIGGLLNNISSAFTLVQHAERENFQVSERTLITSLKKN